MAVALPRASTATRGSVASWPSGERLTGARQRPFAGRVAACTTDTNSSGPGDTDQTATALLRGSTATRAPHALLPAAVSVTGASHLPLWRTAAWTHAGRGRCRVGPSTARIQTAITSPRAPIAGCTAAISSDVAGMRTTSTRRPHVPPDLRTTAWTTDVPCE